MRRIGTTIIACLAATLLFAVPAAGSTDGAPSHPTPPPHPTPPASTPTPTPPTHPTEAPHPTEPPHPTGHGSAVSTVAQGLGQTVSAIAKAGGGTEAIHDAVVAHKEAVVAAAHDGAKGGSDADVSATGDASTAVDARGHGADVSALARGLDGARGATVSALAKQWGELVHSGALVLGDSGERVASADDPDLSLDSGLLPDDDGGATTALRDAADTRLTA